MAPNVTFISDVFHPLVTPLTTYTYTTGSTTSDTVSATDEERLPPGGFSLAHGFPQWFGKSAKRRQSSLSIFSPSTTVSTVNLKDDETDNVSGLNMDRTSSPVDSERPFPNSSGAMSPNAMTTSIIDVLQYMRDKFCDEFALDNLPLEAAGNPGAWKAWKAHRMAQTANLRPGMPDTRTQSPSEEWNWDGVWEERVRRGIDASISESVLYGGGSMGSTEQVFEYLQTIPSLLFD